MLSTRAKESVKTALAMTIAYGIALNMDWDKAYWAAYAVAFCSLSTIGQSMNKAAMRMVGTFLAIVVAFVLIGLFAQQRWLFIAFLSAWLGFCTYMGSGKRYQYFWLVSGFACAVVAIDAGPNAADAFAIATLRAQETALGILVYTLVSILIWPVSTGPQFTAAAGKLASIQHRLLIQCLDQLGGAGDDKAAQSLAGEEATVRSNVGVLLAAAETDDVAIKGSRRQWRVFERLTSELGEALQHWRESLAEYQGIDIRSLIPGLVEFRDEIDRRMAQVESMLAGHGPSDAPQTVPLEIERNRYAELKHFQRAAITVIHERLGIVDNCTRDLFECVASLKGFREKAEPSEGRHMSASVFVPDLDRIANAVRLVLIVWMAWLMVIFVDGLPGGSTIVVICASLGINLAVLPQVKVSLLYRPTVAGMLIGAVVYIFVLPHLHSFLSIGPMIFLVSFALCYRFFEPQQVLSRAMCLALFVMVVAIDNQQVYSILSVLIPTILFLIFFLIMGITQHVPVSLRPDKAFLRLGSRFFRSCAYLVGTMAREPGQPYREPGRVEAWTIAFHRYEVATLPAKLAAWSRFVGLSKKPDTTPEQVQALVTSLRLISRRLQSLIALRDEPQSEALVRTLGADVRAWREEAGELLHGWSLDPNDAAAAALPGGLAARVSKLENRIRETMDESSEGLVSEVESINFYRLLGRYRALSEAMLSFTDKARAIEWSSWHEERFA